MKEILTYTSIIQHGWTQVHFKWNKPVTKIQIMYDATSKRYLELSELRDRK
jgi:hypothetical protein